MSAGKLLKVALAAIILMPSTLHGARQVSAEVNGNTYTNPAATYSVTWDPDLWFVYSVGDAATSTDLSLSDGVGTVYFGVIDLPALPAVCVRALGSELQSEPTFSDFQPLSDVDGSEIASTEDGRAFKAESFTITQDTDSGQVAAYLECRDIGRDDQILSLTFFSPLSTWESEYPVLKDLLLGIEPLAQRSVNATEPPTPAADARPTEALTERTGPETIVGEPGPVFISGSWRLAPFVAVRSSGISAAGLKRKDGKDWIVLVIDVTNWTDDDLELPLSDIRLEFADGTTTAKPSTKSSIRAAAKVGTSPEKDQASIPFKADKTQRVTLAYLVASSAGEPRILIGPDSIALPNLTSDGSVLRKLPPLATPRKLVEAGVDDVVDGHKLVVFDDAAGNQKTVTLRNLLAPGSDGCYAEEALQELARLASDTVWLESESDSYTNPAVYVWTKQKGGNRLLLNYDLLVHGFTYLDANAEGRFAVYLTEARDKAQAAKVGLWAACATTVTATNTQTAVPSSTLSATVKPKASPTSSVAASPRQSPSPRATPASTVTAKPTTKSTAAAAKTTAGPAATKKPTAVSGALPAAVMFRGDPAHTGIQPGPGLDSPAKLPWAFQTGGGIISSPAVVDGVVYIGSIDGDLYALDGFSGPAKWTFHTGREVYSSPTVAGGYVYFGSADANIYAVDRQTGQKHWSFQTDAEIIGSAAVAGGVVYIGSLDGTMYALDADDGTLVWKKKVGQISSSPTVQGNQLLFGASRNLLALDLATGEEAWRYQADSTIETSPAIDGGRVFVGTDAGTLVAVDLDTGLKQWTFAATDAIQSSPAVGDGTVFFGSSDGNVYAIAENDGKPIWTYKTGDEVSASPALFDGKVYIGSQDGFFYGLDAETGKEVWRFESGPIFSSAAIVDGVIFVGAVSGVIFARKPLDFLFS